MTLDEWVQNKWLKPHSSSRQEVKELLAKIDRDLAEAEKPVISADWRLAIAYNACLGCATVALRVTGYRAPEGDGHHFRTIESLRFTLAIDADTIAALQAIRRKRAIISYDAAGTATEAEVKDTVSLARDLHAALLTWLKVSHSNLL